MATFPLLRTGAVTQYPLEIRTDQQSQVMRFLDGTDQRYRLQSRSLRAWRIRLDALDENEMQAIELFFAEQSGGYSAFIFPDPYSGTSVSPCRFADDSLVSEYDGVDVSGTSFWVIETNE